MFWVRRLIALGQDRTPLAVRESCSLSHLTIQRATKLSNREKRILAFQCTNKHQSHLHANQIGPNPMRGATGQQQRLRQTVSRAVVTPTDEDHPKNLLNLKKAELKDKCLRLGLEVSGTKKTLMNRIESYYECQQNETSFIEDIQKFNSGDFVKFSPTTDIGSLQELIHECVARSSPLEILSAMLKTKSVGANLRELEPRLASFGDSELEQTARNLLDLSHTSFDSNAARQKESQIRPSSSSSKGASNGTERSVCDPGKIYNLQTKVILNSSLTLAGIGIVLTEQKEDDSISINRDLETNFVIEQAQLYALAVEYNAVLVACKYAHDRGARKFVLQLENEVLVNQLSGQFSSSKREIQKLYWKVQGMLEVETDLLCLRTEHISPAQNIRAKELALMALAAAGQQADPMFGERLTDFSIHESRPDNDGLTEISNDMIPSHLTVSQSSETFTDISPQKTYLLRFDGGARGNPKGVGGAGMVIYDGTQPTQEVWFGFIYLSKGEGDDDGIVMVTNNQAEYMGFVFVMEQALKLGIRKVVVEGDSELIVRQMNGQYKVRNEQLKPLFAKANELKSQFDEYTVRHIRRAENSRADFLANHAMNHQCSHFDITL